MTVFISILILTAAAVWWLGARLNNILRILQDIKKGEKKMSEWMNTMTAAVERNTALDTSIIALLESIVAGILDSAGDKDAALALAAELDAKSDALAAAILANTPAVEPPVEPPVE